MSQPAIDRAAEPFRDKVLRKCRESMEMKEQFFTRYADQIEALSRGMADYAFIVPSYSIHRIQDVHATVVHIVWDLIHIALGEEDVI